MSVAFRRESDEEHKEPRFELPIPPGPNLVTARGLAMIGAKIAELDAAVAAAANDDGREALRRDLRYWQTRQATAELAPPPPEGEVGIGSYVTYRLGGLERVIQVVGTDEADPAAGHVGFMAPLARAMMGAAAGETLDYNGVADAIEIMSVKREAD